MRLLPDTVAVLAFLLALGAPQARASAPPAPQPGDVVDPVPVVDPTQPAVDEPTPEGSSPPEASAQEEPRVETSPPVVDETAAEAAALPPPRADADADAARPGPLPPPPGPEPLPRVDDTEPERDPAAERRAEVAPSPAAMEAETSSLPEGVGFGGVPAINYDADNGFGFGVVGTLFYYDGVTRPYRAALTLQVFMTSKLIQDHAVILDWLNVGDLPLRLWMRAGYLQSVTQNYCGIGGDVTCDPTVADAAAAAAGLVGDEAETFARRYYLRRFINPYATVQGRYAIAQAPARLEITAGYRGFSFIPGTWDDEDGDGEADLFPYPGSLYEKDFPDGEPGFDSVIQLGLMLDSRDNEPAPTEGVWLEGSVRAASSLIGSTWNWAGANLTLRGYTSVTSDHKLVLANRLVLDGIVGDPPIQELARAGGSNDYYLFGGSEAGRGIRAQRYLGKLRVLDQTELRWRFWDAELWGQHFGFTAAGFVDAGVVGREIAAPGPMNPLVGFGSALRLSWNENFVVRFDVGFSPIEGGAPSLYILIGNPF